MVKRSPTLGALVSTKTKCIKLIFIGKITLVPVAFLISLSIYHWYKDFIFILLTAYLGVIMNNKDFLQLKVKLEMFHYKEKLNCISL